MPTLNWIGKEAVVNHDKEVPFKLLKKIKSASVGESSQNLIIHGDNLEGLKALIPYYHNKVKCIKALRPYNTGNQSWVYNDKVNSPKIKKWLGKVVGGEAEDLCRHDKWLCMMYPRLKLLKELLSDDGIIFVSIDDNELYPLKVILDEIFNPTNFFTCLIWKGMHTVRNSSKDFNQNTEYILVYAKDKTNLIKAGESKTYLRVPQDKEENYPYDDNDGNGKYKFDPLSARNPNTNYEFYFDKWNLKWRPPKGSFCRYSKETLQDMYEKNEIAYKESWKEPKAKRYLSRVQEGVPPSTLLPSELVGFNKDGTSELGELFGNKVFDQPKPVSLIKYLLSIQRQADKNNKDYLVLDSFAGSGTTGHAVLQLNKEDGGKRKFILIQMDERLEEPIKTSDGKSLNTVIEVTRERIKRAIKKYEYNNGFEYCELSKPLFNEEGQIEDECIFEQLATYIYFTETQTNIDKKKISGNFIGDYNEKDLYLIFKEKGKNVLNKSFLSKIKKSENTKVIYADRCLLDENALDEMNIRFKQIPYEVERY